MHNEREMNKSFNHTNNRYL